MSEQPQGGTTGRWLKRITQSMSGEPRDLAELIENLREASERGLFDGDALVMLEGVLAVADMQVRDIMVPRSQMVFVERDESPEKLVELVVESGHSRFPVIGEDRDQILGILLAKDLLRLQAAGDESFEIREYMRPVVFVPESKRLNVLLKEFRRSHNHIAMVVDEYGGVCGLVTIEDVIEQIVGEIDDEHDVEDDQTIRREGASANSRCARSRRSPNFNEYFGTAFSDEEYDTIGGLLMQEFGRLPRRGETIQVGELEFRVLRADRRRIDLLRVITPTDIEPPAADESLLERRCARPIRRVVQTGPGAAGGRIRRRRLPQSRVRALRLVADRGAGSRGAVRADPRPAAAPRLLAGAAFGAGLFAFGTYWLYTCLHVFGLVPVWLTLILQARVGGVDVASIPAVLCYLANRFWLKARRDARVAGAAGPLGAARMAARLGIQRLSMAVARLCVDRFAAGGLGAAVRRLWRDVGRRHDRRRPRCAADAGAPDSAPAGCARRHRGSGARSRVPRRPRLDAQRRTADGGRRRARRRARKTRNGRPRIAMRPCSATPSSRPKLGGRGSSSGPRLPCRSSRTKYRITWRICGRKDARTRADFAIGLVNFDPASKRYYNGLEVLSDAGRRVVLQTALGAVRRVLPGAGIRAFVDAADELALR